ncbi:WD40 repeat domain-containing protein, partial [Hyalangium sp.]|uniref:WD40 repeat domain-containing protein n=1 Tax=Hyalangium sp. TaxID=2028555 RepID=UPI002D599887|nr:hypothetical protein [Hyalangium sp.]
MRNGARLLLAGVLVLGVSCAHGPQGLAPEVRSVLAERPGSYAAGRVKGMADGPLLNNKDFVYSIAFSPDSSRVAYTHLGPKFYQLALWTLGTPPVLVADKNINAYEFDLEAVSFSQDGGLVATAGRDGAVRLFDSATGEP